MLSRYFYYRWFFGLSYATRSGALEDYNDEYVWISKFVSSQQFLFYVFTDELQYLFTFFGTEGRQTYFKTLTIKSLMRNLVLYMPWRGISFWGYCTNRVGGRYRVAKNYCSLVYRLETNIESPSRKINSTCA